jgi:hypothetical protein
MLSVFMLSVITPCVVLLMLFVLSVVKLNVAAPYVRLHH